MEIEKQKIFNKILEDLKQFKNTLMTDPRFQIRLTYRHRMCETRKRITINHKHKKPGV